MGNVFFFFIYLQHKILEQITILRKEAIFFAQEESLIFLIHVFQGMYECLNFQNESPLSHYINFTVLIFAHDLTNCKVDTKTTSNRKVDTLDYCGNKMVNCVDILLVLFSVLRFA